MTPRFLLVSLSELHAEELRLLGGLLQRRGRERDLSEEEEVSPALLVDGGGLWKQPYQPKVLGEAVEKPEGSVKPERENAAPLSSRLFSYRMEEVARSSNSRPPPPHQETARTARYISHYSDWGHLATISTQDKGQRKRKWQKRTPTMSRMMLFCWLHQYTTSNTHWGGLQLSVKWSG
ncbi:protein CREG2-like [Lampris incognitus]|uniref:protein CREG2-like n=1 Tax=Lampris incognitus TaxID=2546036 RepID=UPI0024B5FA10|nr:protein CREG2-like [Lampris incognitus]